MELDKNSVIILIVILLILLGYFILNLSLEPGLNGYLVFFIVIILLTVILVKDLEPIAIVLVIFVIIVPIVYIILNFSVKIDLNEFYYLLALIFFASFMFITIDAMFFNKSLRPTLKLAWILLSIPFSFITAFFYYLVEVTGRRRLR